MKYLSAILILFIFIPCKYARAQFYNMEWMEISELINANDTDKFSFLNLKVPKPDKIKPAVDDEEEETKEPKERKFSKEGEYYSYLLEREWDTYTLPEFNDDGVTFEEILVKVNFNGYLRRELTAIYSNKELMLPIVEIFSHLKIKIDVTYNRDSTYGYINGFENRYMIDLYNGVIYYNNTIYPLEEHDILLTTEKIYIRSSLMEIIFGIKSQYNFQLQTVQLTSDKDFPLFREKMINDFRRTSIRNSKEILVDKSYPRNYSLFSPMIADWNINNSYQHGGEVNTYARLNTGVELAGGEANTSIFFNSHQEFDWKNQFFKWRYVNNNNSIIRQVSAGFIGSQSISTIYGPVLGVQVNNTSSHGRSNFGIYVISDYTQPGWTVELYVNNELRQYIKADERGHYQFEIPLNYGRTEVYLKFYGLHGEEQIEQKSIVIPHFFVPTGKMDYSLSSGKILQEQNFSTDNTGYLSRLNLNYGVSHWLTIGAGAESVHSGDSFFVLPFAALSTRFSEKLFLSSEYVYEVRSKTDLNYQITPKVMMNIYYTNYTSGQQVLRQNYLSEKGFTISSPLSIASQTFILRAKYDNIVLQNLQYNVTSITASSSFYKFSASASAGARWLNTSTPMGISDLSLTYRMSGKIKLNSYLQYNISQNYFTTARMIIDARLRNNIMSSLIFEFNPVSQKMSGEIRIGFNLPMSRVNATFRKSGNQSVYNQSLGGSLLYDAHSVKINAVNQDNVGKGGITFIPFLDLNNNGIRDNDEPIVSNLEVKILGGKLLNMKDDGYPRFINLQPFTNYIANLSLGGDYDFSWHLPYKTVSITIDPNQFKKVEVPITVNHEAEGKVFLKNGSGMKPQERIRIVIESDEGKIIDQILSSREGMFYFTQVPSGKYKVYVDPGQLKNLSLETTPPYHTLEITGQPIGELHDQLNFILTPPN